MNDFTTPGWVAAHEGPISLSVSAREWMDSYGNTYHTWALVAVTVEYSLGKPTLVTRRYTSGATEMYGGSRHYLDTCASACGFAGYSDFVRSTVNAYVRYRRFDSDECTTVQRKRDLWL